MTLFEKLSIGLASLQSGALIAVLLVYVKQLTAMRQQLTAMQQQVQTAQHAAHGQNILSLANYLQAEHMREARRIVMTTLADRGFANWTEEEKQAANKVCSSYGIAAIALDNGLVPLDPVMEYWGASIRRCHGILRKYIEDMQRPENQGPTYWKPFVDLSARVSAHRSGE